MADFLDGILGDSKDTQQQALPPQSGGDFLDSVLGPSVSPMGAAVGQVGDVLGTSGRIMGIPSPTAYNGSVMSTVARSTGGSPEAISRVAVPSLAAANAIVAPFTTPYPAIERGSKRVGEFLFPGTGVVPRAERALLGFVTPSSPLDIATVAMGSGALGKAGSAIESAGRGLGIGLRSEEMADKLIKSSSKNWRTLLRPSVKNVKNIEIKAGKDIDRYMDLAAKEQLSVETATDRVHMDTRTASEKLKTSDIQGKIHSMLEDRLKSHKKTFDIEKIRADLHKKIESTNTSAYDAEKEKAALDNLLDAEVRRIKSSGGATSKVSALDLNKIKQGFWSISFDGNNPIPGAVGRMAGHELKSVMDRTLDDKMITALNEASGDYSTLKTLLEASHGQKIPVNRLTRYAGGLVGGYLGHFGGVPGTAFGMLTGQDAAARIASFMSSPERVTAKAAKKIGKAAAILAKEGKTITKTAIDAYLERNP